MDWKSSLAARLHPLTEPAAHLVKRGLHRLGYDLVPYHPHAQLLIERLRPSSLLDIGANTGQYAAQFLARRPDTEVISFEPLADCFAALQQNLAAFPTHRACHTALGEENGERDIIRNTFSPSTSFLPMSDLLRRVYPHTAEERRERIRVRRLDDLVAEHPEWQLRAPLMIKMDVQGFEDRVIAGGPDTIRRAALVHIETSFKPLYEGQPLFNDIAARLAALGFVYDGHSEQNFSPLDGELLFEDSLFVRRDLL